MGTYIRRNDIVPALAAASISHNYLMISKEAATPTLLQTVVNNLLVNGPGNTSKVVGIHVVDIQYLTTGSGGNLKYVAFILIYFTGNADTTQFNP